MSFVPPETQENLDPRCDAYRGDDKMIRCVLHYGHDGNHSDGSGSGERRIWLEPLRGRRLESFLQAPRATRGTTGTCFVLRKEGRFAMMTNPRGEVIELDGLEWIDKEGGATHFPDRLVADAVATLLGASLCDVECPFGARH